LKIEALRSLDNKAEALSDYLESRSLTWGDVWYIGNDVNDLESLAKAEISFCPFDASPEVFSVSKVVLSRRGGDGVLSEIASRLEKLGK
jgi:3-deoxy-D-manno-octulosonate 8-phosphate phosphatase KdsC-like HAD superfamily phosphatase